MRRVVVTGLGVVSPVGNNVDEFWSSLINGRSGITYLREFENLETGIGGRIKDFDFAQYNLVEPRDIRRLDLISQYALVAAHQALNIEIEENNDIGVIVGVGIGGEESWEKQYTAYLTKGPSRVSPLTIPLIMGNAPSANISIVKNLKGPVYAAVSACASATHSMIDAYKAVRDSDADAVLTGGAESIITGFVYSAFSNMRAMIRQDAFKKIAEELSIPESPEIASRPFDALRAGFVMGEGAGILMLEELEHAKKRNAEIYAEMVGYGYSADAKHITDSNPDGPAKAMRMALKRAGISPEKIGYINAHGTSTQQNDSAETQAIKEVFGRHAYNLLISSTKSMTGHLVGAAGGIEAIAAILVLKHGIIPPTINLIKPDPECDLDYVANVARKANIEYAMSNSFGFGGHNAVVVFKRI